MEKFPAAIGRRWTFMEHMELLAYRDRLLACLLRRTSPRPVAHLLVFSSFERRWRRRMHFDQKRRSSWLKLLAAFLDRYRDEHKQRYPATMWAARAPKSRPALMST
jgi:hypothetical protein